MNAPAAPARAGFRLKPKGGPAVRLTVLEAERPRLYRDGARLRLGRMRTTQVFQPEGEGTRVTVRIETTGLLLHAPRQGMRDGEATPTASWPWLPPP